MSSNITLSKQKNKDKLELTIELEGSKFNESILPSVHFTGDLDKSTIRKFMYVAKHTEGKESTEPRVKSIMTYLLCRLNQVYKDRPLLPWRNQEFRSVTMSELLDQIKIKGLLKI